MQGENKKENLKKACPAGITTWKAGQEILTFNPHNGKILWLNGMAAKIFQALNKGKGKEEIASAVRKKFPRRENVTLKEQINEVADYWKKFTGRNAAA